MLDPTRNRRQFVEKLEAASVSGFPGLLDSVEQAAEIASSMLARSPVRVAVLYLTDGEIEDYRGDYVSSVVNPSDSGDLSRRFRDRLIQEKISSLAASLGRFSAPLFFVHLEEQNDSLNVAYQNGHTRVRLGHRRHGLLRARAGRRALAHRPHDRGHRVHLYRPRSRTRARRGAAAVSSLSSPAAALLTHRPAFEAVQSK